MIIIYMYSKNYCKYYNKVNIIEDTYSILGRPRAYTEYRVETCSGVSENDTYPYITVDTVSIRISCDVP